MLWGIYSAIYGKGNVSVEKYVEIKGDYVEKQQSCFISVTLKSWSSRKLLDPTTQAYTKQVRKATVRLWNYKIQCIMKFICSSYIKKKLYAW